MFFRLNKFETTTYFSNLPISLQWIENAITASSTTSTFGQLSLEIHGPMCCEFEKLLPLVHLMRGNWFNHPGFGQVTFYVSQQTQPQQRILDDFDQALWLGGQAGHGGLSEEEVRTEMNRLADMSRQANVCTWLVTAIDNIRPLSDQRSE